MPQPAKATNVVMLPHTQVPSHTTRLNRFQVVQVGQEHAIRRLEQLEGRIQQYSDTIQHPEWLNEYIDLGLDLAEHAGSRNLRPLQESWLKRIYKTLRDTAFNLDCHENWRQQCLDFLYQPFFALQHFYREQPNGRQKVRLLFKDLSMITRYVV
ncbi:hypothetical protein [Bacterioplanoides sp. SCSIO 12839]|uniref:hypothetical protein n=1 Tax=Bacterioplanoides sp. SCSIO 12839 TaxID=2829569 RepID=UPI0021030EC6|nr:hypothetical protein [Bacterioplanoides sp. SCSIO 12839]UTW47881.1 hypothetical protein KFF03_15140 [Bacterioplanoides sp. SCSIO 12839]